MDDRADARMTLDPYDLTEHLPELRALAARLARSREEAEDLVQETLLSAVASVGQLRQPELAGAWLLRILRRKWYDALRRRPRERAAAAPEPAAPEAPRPPDDALREALKALPAEERRILELRYFESRSSVEIGRILGKPPGSIRSSLFYALRRLETLCRSEADR
jgi:RNA polymerase sigma-70 factor (ECF subfamily)